MFCSSGETDLKLPILWLHQFKELAIGEHEIVIQKVLALTSRNTLGGPCRPKHLGDPSNQDFRDFNFLGDCFWYNLKIEKSRELEVLRPGRHSLITITIIITSSSPCSSKLHSSSHHEQASTSNQHQHQQMNGCHLLDLKSSSSSSVLRL